jgi:hypothetical protein
MRMHRAIAITLSVLLLSAFGCHDHTNNVILLPSTLVQTPKEGDRITWRLTNQVVSVKLKIPQGICDFSPAQTPVTDPQVITLDSNTPELTCTVLHQPDNGGFPISYTYTYDITNPSTPTGPTPKGVAPQGPVILLIPSSCQGCGNQTPLMQGHRGAASGLPYQIVCDNGTPKVLPSGDIEVTPDVASVNWTSNGATVWTIKFDPGQTQACSNYGSDGTAGQGTAGQEQACIVNNSARPAPGTPTGTSYPYQVTLSTCSNGKTPGSGSLILDALIPQAPK